jgi:hypothetical protein
MPLVISIYIPRSGCHSHIPSMFFHAPRRVQFRFPAPTVTRTFLECCLMPSAVSIHILLSGSHSHIPSMFLHALGSFNLHPPFRWLITHSLNAVSRPRQFQFTFPAPAVIRTFLECCLMPSAISISIPRSGGQLHIT